MLNKYYIINNGTLLGRGSTRSVYQFNNKAYKIALEGAEWVNKDEYDNYQIQNGRYDNVVAKIYSISEDKTMLECELLTPLFDYILNKHDCNSEDLLDDFCDLDIYKIIDKYCENEVLNYSKLYELVHELELNVSEYEFAMNWGVDLEGKLKFLDYAY